MIEAGQFGSRQRKAAALEASDLEEILNLRGSDLAVGKGRPPGLGLGASSPLRMYKGPR